MVHKKQFKHYKIAANFGIQCKSCSAVLDSIFLFKKIERSLQYTRNLRTNFRLTEYSNYLQPEFQYIENMGYSLSTVFP